MDDVLFTYIYLSVRCATRTRYSRVKLVTWFVAVSRTCGLKCLTRRTNIVVSWSTRYAYCRYLFQLLSTWWSTLAVGTFKL